MGDESEWNKLPTDEKVQHKAWKARVAGYEEAVKLFTKLDDEKSPEFSKYLGLVKKMTVDSNAIAQEKALDVVLAFVTNAHVAGRTAGEVCNGIVTKCLNSSRTKTKEKAVEILMMYIEIEKHEIVQEELIKGFANKQPKIVAACVQCATAAVRDFGSKIIQIKPLVKQMQKLLEDRDKTVREETKQMVVQMYHWVGPALKPQLANLKPVQISELEAEFEKLPAGKPRQQRFLRSQQDLKQKMEEEVEQGGQGEDEDQVDEANEEIDAFELMTPVDVISKLPKDYYEKIEAKKWQERKEALEAVQKLVDGQRLEQGDYHDLVKTLKKVIAKDTNVMLVALAAKCLNGLAFGLRKKFSSHALGSIDVVLEKFKEKKITVVTALREVSDTIFLTTTLDVISESCVAALNHKTPTVKSETALFMARCFCKSTPATLPKKLLKMFAAPLIKTINDTSGDVREASFQALGTAMKVVGEKPLTPFIAEVDSIKLAKIKECCEKAEVVGKRSGGGAAAKPVEAKPAPKAVAKPPPAKKTESKPKAASAAIKGGKKPAAKAKKGGQDAASTEKTEQILSDDAVEEKIKDLLPAESLSGLASNNWKERLAAMEKFLEILKLMSKEEIPCQVCVRTVTKKPGLKETNFQVMKLKVELISHLAQNSIFTKQSAEFCLTDLVDKAGDVKNGSSVKECLSCIAEATSIEHVSQEVVRKAFEQKNPKNQSEILNWLAGAIKEFGFKINVKTMIANIKKAFAATNPAIRTAAITLVGVIYMYMGAPLRVCFEDEKAALLQQIDAEFEKVKGEKPPPITRGAPPQQESVEDEEESAEAETVNVADLIPRNDISDKITPELLSELEDKNWKVRSEALQRVVAILNEAKFITANVGGLPEALKKRLGDSNKIIVQSALSILSTVSTSMGPQVKQHMRVVGPGILACMGDSKPQVRAAAVTTLNNWVEHSGLPLCVEAELFSDALKLENPSLRAELLGWLAEKLPASKKLPAELNICVQPLFSALEDRNGDVRKKAQEALVPFMIHIGFEFMARQANKLKPASKTQVSGLLDKARENLPQKPKKVAAAAAPPPSAKVQSKPEPVEEDEPERPNTAPAGNGNGGKGNSNAKGRAKSAAPAKKGATTKKKTEDDDTGPPIKTTTGKEQRFKDEKSRKVLKWNFTAPTPEFVEQLHTQMEAAFSKTMIDHFFNERDFKHHIKALDILSTCVDTAMEETIGNTDLILKWVSLRFFDTNTTVLLKALEYLQSLFTCLTEQEYHLHELEASAFLPYLINKVGDPKDNIRKAIRCIFRQVCMIFPASKMFSLIIDGIKSKNSKQRTECLDELSCLIEVYGINVCQPSPAQAMKIVAQQISDRDNSVRSAALNTLVLGHSIIGEPIYKYIGRLSDKDLGMLEERIKRSGKNRMSPEEKPKVAAKIPPTTSAKQAPESRIGRQQDSRQVQQRPAVKKAFQLDLADVESTLIDEYSEPELIQVDNGTEEFACPVELPKTRLRPPSPSLKLLGMSSDAKTVIDLVISQVASHDTVTSIQAFAQIDEVLKNEEKSEMLEAHVDQLLIACTLQLRMTASRHMNDELSKETIIRLYKCLLASLLALFQSSKLAPAATKDVLKDLVLGLVRLMLDRRLAELEVGAQIVRSINIMIVKIMDKSDPTCMTCALIKLLHETVASENSSDKMLEMVMKCLWKCVRMLPKIVDTLRVHLVLEEIALFTKAFPSASWKNRSADLPMRTVKTVLHSLTKLLRNQILGYMANIEEGSEVRSYVFKVLQNLGGESSNTSTTTVITNGTSTEVELRSLKKDKNSSKRDSRVVNEMLTEIFRKIGSKENTREGLNDLYDFKEKHPEADLEPFLKRSSQFFQNYIERGLKNIEIERQSKKEAMSSTDADGTDGIDFGQVDPTVYKEKLKILRARFHLNEAQTSALPSNVEPKDESENDVPPSLTTSSSTPGMAQLGSSITKTSSEPSNLGDPAAGVADLKRRLERIKNSAKK